MSVTSHIIEVQGEYFGHALSLGRRYEFYTQREDLRDLNGRVFESLAELREAVEKVAERSAGATSSASFNSGPEPLGL